MLAKLLVGPSGVGDQELDEALQLVADPGPMDSERGGRVMETSRFLVKFDETLLPGSVLVAQPGKAVAAVGDEGTRFVSSGSGI
jgi:hypothetical protein